MGRKGVKAKRCWALSTNFLILYPNVCWHTHQTNFPVHNLNFLRKVKVLGSNLGYLLKSSLLYWVSEVVSKFARHHKYQNKSGFNKNLTMVHTHKYKAEYLWRIQIMKEMRLLPFCALSIIDQSNLWILQRRCQIKMQSCFISVAKMTCTFFSHKV